MTTASEHTETRRGWSERWSPLGGLAFALGFIALLIFAQVDTGETPEEVIAAAEDKEGEMAATFFFALASIPLLLWFISGLHARVSRLQSQTAPALVLAGGTAFTLLFFVALIIFSGALLNFPGEADATAQANAYLLIDDISWFALGGGGIAFALMAVAASIAALRSGAVPNWLGWLGAVVGLASAATIAFVGIFAWIAWILVTSILLLVRRA